MIADNVKLRLANGVVGTLEGEELVLVDESGDRVYGVDGPAAEAVELLNQGKTFGEAVQALLITYDVDPGTLRADLQSSLSKLISSGIVIAT